uniref:Protein translocase subunit SecY n=1 Tax=Asterionellopsis glacialis TaxID=33640 RepID=A0A023HC26_9STRA|nr:SecY-type transporter protein [Asterionellopsis glacialis]AGH28357.1 SecY-type transporter protein [Asterionellopsis glacialis]
MGTNNISNKRIGDIILQRSLLTLGVLLFIRIGTFLPVPGINHSDLAFYIQRHSFTKSLVSTFSGDDTFVIGLFTLNIFPYINASILIQLILGFYPKLSKLQKEGDLAGRRTINRLTRLITLIWAIIQSLSVALYLKRILFDWNIQLASEIILWLTTGAMIVLWLSELITEYGLGNGASLLIYTNIISNFPNLYKKVISENSENLNLGSIGIIVVLFFISLYGIVLLQKGVRRIPLISSKELNQSTSRYSAQPRNYIPLSLNQAGVMPIILTTAVLVLPNYISTLGILPTLTLPVFANFSKVLYWISYFVLILIFSSFYSTLILNPKDISDQLQKMTVSIPGIRPGIETAFYLKQVMKRVTLIGSTMLALLATLPNLIQATFNISSLNGLSTTSLLIVAGVILDILREVKSIYYSNIYNNMYK